MPSHKIVSCAVVSATILVIAATFDSPSFAAAPNSAEARYQQDRANCLAGKTDESQKTCLREAGARLQAAHANDLSAPSAAQLAANARKRCDVFKNDDDKRSCLARVDDGTTSGSVAAGGDLREYREVIPAPESMPPTSAGAAPTSGPTPLPQGQ